MTQMVLFSRKQGWEQTFRLRSHQGAGRGFLVSIFWIWGIVGLFLNAGNMLGLTGAVGVGTSAYLTASSLIWIGGMVLFGLGALLSDNDFQGERPLPPDTGDVRTSHD